MTPRLLFDYIMAAGCAIFLLCAIAGFTLAMVGFFDKDK